MASDSMNKIAEAENQASVIEEEAEAKVNAILTEAERLSAVRAEEITNAAMKECQKMILDAEEKRQLFEEDRRKSCESDILALRTNIASKVPQAVAQVRNILIGRE